MNFKFFLSLILMFSAVEISAQITQKGVFSSYQADFESSKTISVKQPIVPKNSQNKNGRFYFGYNIDVEIDFFSNADVYENDSVNIYKLNIYSKNAHSLGLYFSDFRLENGSELYIEGKNFMLGAITSINNSPTNDLQTSQIEGDSLIILLYVPKKSNQKTFVIKSFCYDYANLYQQINKLSKATSICSIEKDVNCFDDAYIQEVKQAVCRYTISEGNSVYLCTGSLVNNVKNDSTPYFITAAHCVCKQSEAKNAVFYFNYEKTICGGQQIAQTNQTISGSTLLATSPRTKSGFEDYADYDFTLLKLNDVPPRNYLPYYLGFNLDESTVSDTVFCIHHPQGNYKKLSISYNSPEISSYPNDDDVDANYKENSHWHIKKWDVGTTESGSSGSALINNKKQIIGVLSGGYASCSSAEDDYFQMFSKAWTAGEDSAQQLKYWLNPLNDNTELGSIGVTDYPQPFTSAAWNGDSTVAKVWWNIADFDCNFENITTLQDLSNVFLANVDIDGYDTKIVNNVNNGSSQAWKVISQDGDYAAFSGEKCVASFTSNVQQTNDYLTLPKITVKKDYVLYFYAKAVDGVANLKISQNTKATNYNTIEEFSVSNDWKLYKIPLTDYVGKTIYLNINNITESTGATALLIDNLSVMPDTSKTLSSLPSGYLVFVNSVLVEAIDNPEVTTFDYPVSERGIYNFYVRAFYDDGGESDYANVATLNNIKQTKTAVEPLDIYAVKNYIFPNPTSEKINFLAGKNFKNSLIYISDCSGQIIYVKRNVNITNAEKIEFDVSGLKSGFYIFTIIDFEKKYSYKFIKL